MKTTTHLTNDETVALEHLLDEAGISYTVVDRCPVEGCVECDPATVSLAA